MQFIYWLLCFFNFTSFCRYDASKQSGTLPFLHPDFSFAYSSPPSWLSIPNFIEKPTKIHKDFFLVPVLQHTEKKVASDFILGPIVHVTQHMCSSPDQRLNLAEAARHVSSTTRSFQDDIPIPRTLMPGPTWQFIPFVIFHFILICMCCLITALSRRRESVGIVSVRFKRSMTLRPWLRYVSSLPIMKAVLSGESPFRFLTVLHVQSIYSKHVRQMSAPKPVDQDFHTRSFSFISNLLEEIIGQEPLPEQVACCQRMYDVADGYLLKSPVGVVTITPDSQLLSPSQHSLFARVRRRNLSLFNLVVQGNAGCSKTTMYLALAVHHKVTVVVPSNELADDVEQRALDADVVITVLTQHVVFDFDQSDALLIMDEIWLLPEWHVRAIAALSERSIGFGDPYQTNDLGFGQLALSAFSIHPLEPSVELRTSFTVPQDVMAKAIELRLVPAYYRTLSKVKISMRMLRSIAHFSCPVVTGSRECKSGYANDRTYTIVTIQGARVTSLVAHICGRDLSVLEPSANFSTGYNRSKLLWTMLSRHSQDLYLDFAPAFFSSFGSWDLPFAENDHNITYLESPDFQVEVIHSGPRPGTFFQTFTPVTVEFLGCNNIRIYNVTHSHLCTIPIQFSHFPDIDLRDEYTLPHHTTSKTIIISRIQ
jgi:hypothetical protein